MKLLIAENEGSQVKKNYRLYFDQTYRYLNTPLIKAASNGIAWLVEIVMANPEVNINAVNVSKESALFKAVRRHHLYVVEVLAANERVVLKPADNDGQTPLMTAAGKQDSTTLRLLLDRRERIDVNANTQTHWGDSTSSSSDDGA